MQHEIDLTRLSESIRERRERQGLRIVAKEVGVSFSTLSRIENGKLPDINSYFKICRWLNVPGDYFRTSL